MTFIPVTNEDNIDILQGEFAKVCVPIESFSSNQKGNTKLYLVAAAFLELSEALSYSDQYEKAIVVDCDGGVWRDLEDRLTETGETNHG